MLKQKGMSMIGTLFAVVAFILISILLLKMVPVYIQHYTIVSSVEALNKVEAEELSINPEMNVAFLKQKLLRQFDMNQIEGTMIKNIKMSAKDRNNYVVTLDYEEARHLFFNISLLFKFHDEVEVHIE